MNDATLVLGLATGAMKLKRRTRWNLGDPIQAWIELGQANPWICNAWDPPFDRRSFTACASLDHLKERLLHGNWSLGSAFHFEDICFIQQVAGGDEWLVIRRGLAFESASCARIIRNGHFDDFWRRIVRASENELCTLRY